MAKEKKRIAKQLTITIHPRVLAEVDARSRNRSGQIEGDLERYYALLRAERVAMRLSLSKWHQADILRHAVPEGEGFTLFDLDSEIIKWVYGLSATQRLAVCDAIARYRYQVSRGMEPEPRLFEED